MNKPVSNDGEAMLNIEEQILITEIGLKYWKDMK
jgi:hypothetical protein